MIPKGIALLVLWKFLLSQRKRGQPRQQRELLQLQDLLGGPWDRGKRWLLQLVSFSAEYGKEW